MEEEEFLNRKITPQTMVRDYPPGYFAEQRAKQEELNKLRDRFAMAALTGLIPFIGIPDDGPDTLWDADTARRAYELADAMIAQREKRK